MSTTADSAPPPYPTNLKDVDIPPSYDVAAAQAQVDALTPEERKRFEDGVAKAMSAEDIQPALKQASEIATGAVKNIEDMFVTLTSELTSIDAQYTKAGDDGFAPKLAIIQQVRISYCSEGWLWLRTSSVWQKFRTTVWDSQKLALKVAHYGESGVCSPFSSIKCSQTLIRV
jgi:hypothetical protein